MESRFIRPDTRTLTISQGDTLVVRARLTAGEQRAQFARMCPLVVEGRREIDPIHVRMATVTAYLLDWSLRGSDGLTVPIRDLPIEQLERTLDQLAPDDFTEIYQAIDAHETAMAAERAAQKKTRSGVTPSSVTSGSPVGSAGATNGSGISTPISMTS